MDGYTITQKIMDTEIKYTQEEIDRAEKESHVGLKRAYGLENLYFYEGSTTSRPWRGYCCKYIADPYDFDIKESINSADLMFLLQALSMQQGKVYFADHKQFCVGIDALKTLYLPMKLAGLT